MERRTFFKTTIAASVPVAVGGIIDSLRSLVAAAEKQNDDQPAGSGDPLCDDPGRNSDSEDDQEDEYRIHQVLRSSLGDPNAR